MVAAENIAGHPADPTPYLKRHERARERRPWAHTGSGMMIPILAAILCLQGGPTAEEMLAALQKRRPQNVIIPPAGVPDMEALKAKAALWPEGTVAIDRPGILLRDGASWRFQWSDDLADRPMRVLPNATLDDMIRMTSAAQEPSQVIDRKSVV